MRYYKISVLLIALGIISSASAWVPTFTVGTNMDSVIADGLKVGDTHDGIGYPSPGFGDWDGDGLDDMLIGCWDQTLGGGKIRYFKNVGTASSPSFVDKGNLYAGGSVISLEAG